ncbi:MAG: hypothetical protein ACREC5_02540 [Thermoplasmata archaeon]
MSGCTISSEVTTPRVRSGRRRTEGWLRPGTAVLLWTGGKDSILALHEARARGWSISALVTFGPGLGSFRAHPLRVMRMQAQALGLPHRLYRIRPPYRAAYRGVFRTLRDEGVEAIVTGDIAPVDDRANWVRSIAEPLGLRVLAPLWHQDRMGLLRRLRPPTYEVVVSYVNTDRLDAAWVGRRIDADARRELNTAFRERGVDPAGENGEYHTWTLDAPLFRSRLSLQRVSIRGDRRSRWLRAARLALIPKPGPTGTSRSNA